MAERLYLLAHVSFSAKASLEDRDALGRAAEAAGVRWDEMLIIVRCVLEEACRVATGAAIREMLAHWSAEEWRDAKKRFV